MGTVTDRSRRYVEQFRQEVTERSNFDALWRQVAHVCWPDAGDFYQADRAGVYQGSKRNQAIYDSTATQSLRYYTSIIESMTMPRGALWHRLSVDIPEVVEDYESQIWLDKLNKLVYRERYKPTAGFREGSQSVFMSHGALGNGCLYADRVNRKNRYKPCFMGDTYFTPNFQGIIDGVKRRFRFTHEQAVQQWGKNAPSTVLAQVEKNPKNQDEYLHCVMPNDDYQEGALLPEKRQYLELYIHLPSGEELSASGYSTFPFAISRGQIVPGEWYGRGEGGSLIGHINVLQKMSQLDLKGWELERLPPLLARDDGILGGRMQISLRPGDITWGGLSEQGQQLVQPLNASGRMTPIGDKRMEQERAAIREGFMVNLYQILVREPNMTATQAMIRAQEKAGLLIPNIGPLQDGFAAQVVSREIDLLEADGTVQEIGPPPPLLREIAAAGELDLVVQFDAPINRLADQEGIEGMRSLIEEAIQIDSITGKPQELSKLNIPYYFRRAAVQRNVPPEFIKSDAEIAEKERADAESEQAAMAVNGAPQIAKAAKDFATAQQIAQGG